MIMSESKKNQAEVSPETLSMERIKKIKRGRDIICMLLDNGTIICVPYEIIISYQPGDEFYDYYKKFLD